MAPNSFTFSSQSGTILGLKSYSLERNNQIYESCFLLTIFITWCCLCSNVYKQLVKSGEIVPKPEKRPPTVPMDYNWAQVFAWLQMFGIVLYWICFVWYSIQLKSRCDSQCWVERCYICCFSIKVLYFQYSLHFMHVHNTNCATKKAITSCKSLQELCSNETDELQLESLITF